MIPTVLVVDDQTLVRSGIRSLLDGTSEVRVIGEVGSGNEALEICRKLTPDIVLADVEMPHLNGIELARQISKAYPKTSVIMVSMHSDEQYVIEALRAGAVGYVLKDAAIAELLTAIRTVAGGQRYLSPSLTDVVMTDYVRRSRGEQSSSELDKLSPREREILQLISEGFTSVKVSEMLFLSVRTVDTHRTNIMQKLKIHSIAGLTKFAISHGLTSTRIK